MAYDQGLADRVLAEMDDEPDVMTRKMFGGLCVMWRGNMLGGVIGDDLALRVGADAYDDLVNRPGARPMDFTGRPMKGMLMVSPSVLGDEKALAEWIGKAKDFVGTLPAK
ncbi:MAG: TfoX/Sxy family protein [Candidatus Nanopelagicales bacterium]|nr:TfoX/Sxy family protein [Candidatus Nanopelagicales bacterium]